MQKEHPPLDKRSRQDALLRVVRRQTVANQAELVRRLRILGLPATQASISRDLRELDIVKVNGRYQPVAALGRSHPGGPDDALPELISSCEPVGANLVVVRTRIGAAGTVAVEIDRRRSPDIAGTVAGDDTILVAVKSRSAQGRVVAWLARLTERPRESVGHKGHPR